MGDLVTMSAADPKFFGFAEFLSGLALMVLAWTIGDVRYRFRIRTAPMPLLRITFFGMAVLGILTLATDLWRAQEWPIPVGPITPAMWQAMLASLFLLTFLLWIWFAFIKPPIYGRMNSKRFATVLYRTMLNGSSEELAVAADELVRSVSRIVFFSRQKLIRYSGQAPPPKFTEVEDHANAILLLMGDARFCRAVVASSPVTALAVFEDVAKTQKYKIPIETFARNIVLEAINNRDSFLFHESTVFDSGLIGHRRPITTTIFKNFEMIESIRSLLDPDGVKMMKWDSEQWEAYCRITLLALEDYAAKGFPHEVHLFSRAKDHLVSAARDIYQLNGIDTLGWDREPYKKLQVVVDFVRDTIKLLDKHPVSEGIRLRALDRNRNLYTVYDLIAEMMFEIVFSASSVSSPRSTCWAVQHNAVWSQLFEFRGDGKATQIIHFKFRRLVYDEIKRMNSFVNFKGAKILGYCLNVMGQNVKNNGSLNPHTALHRAVLGWLKKYYGWLHFKNPEVAEACLMAEWTYDEANSRLVHTRPAGGLRTEPWHGYLSVNRYVLEASNVSATPEEWIDVHLKNRSKMPVNKK